MKTMTLSLSACLMLSGCGALISTPYQRPDLNVPAVWAQGSTQQNASTTHWWEAFNDPVLTDLINQALTRNNNVGKALLNVRRAQLLAGLARENEHIQLGTRVQADRSKPLDGGSTSRSHSLNLSASWEADLWNRLGSTTDAAKLEAMATSEDYQAIRLSLTGTVTSLYWRIAYLNERLAASTSSIAYTRQTLALVQARHEAGQVSALELAEARQSLETQRAADSALQQERIEQRNALALLFDATSAPAFPEPQSLNDALLPSVDAGLPAALLAQRPDLRASELRLRKSLKTVDATRASYYPDLSLTGALGYSSTALGMLLQNPIGALGAGLTLPFLQWQQMQMDISVSRTDYEMAVHDFRQTLYQALVDVENALAARRQLQEQAGMRERALGYAREAEAIYQARYQAGAETLQSWLNAQETRRSAQITLSEARLSQLLNYVALSEALGGGIPAQAHPALPSDSERW